MDCRLFPPSDRLLDHGSLAVGTDPRVPSTPWNLFSLSIPGHTILVDVGTQVGGAYIPWQRGDQIPRSSASELIMAQR